MIMPVAVTDAAAINNHRMIQQRPIAIRRILQLGHKGRKLLHVIAVNRRHFIHQSRIVAVVRQAMVPIGNANLAVPSVASFPRQHERRNARNIGLQRQRHQVEHQLRMLAILQRNAVRLLHGRHRHGVLGRLFLGHLHLALHFAHRRQILIQLALVGVTQAARQLFRIVRHQVQNALVDALAAQPRCRIARVFATTKQTFKHRTRIHFRRIRNRSTAPRDAVHIRAGITRIAVPCQVTVFNAKLQRRQPRLRTNLLRRHLIHRCAHRNIRTCRLARMHARQETGGRTRVVARTIAQRFAVMIFQASEDNDVVMHRRQRLQNLRQIERPSQRLRPPVPHIDAIRHIAEHHAVGRGFCRRLRAFGHRAERGHHCVQHRQRQRRTYSAQQTAPGNMFTGNNHSVATPASPRPMRNGTLCTIPVIKLENL